MGFGVGLFLMAVGAIMAFAVHVEDSGGFDINTIGVILMIVGALGIVLSMLFWNSWGGFHRRDEVVTDRYDDGYDRVPRRRRRVVEDL
jgi:hypothetical protein